jgi:hypothetical protein
MVRQRYTLVALVLLIVVDAWLAVEGAARFLPIKVVIALAAWLLVSAPLGVGIGHCVMNRE